MKFLIIFESFPAWKDKQVPFNAGNEDDNKVTSTESAISPTPLQRTSLQDDDVFPASPDEGICVTSPK